MTLPNTEEYYQKLAEKWLTGRITAEEKAEFSDWYNQHQDLPLNIPPHIATSDQEMHDRILLKIRNEIATAIPQRRRASAYGMVAACVALFAISFFVYFITVKPDHQALVVVNHTIPPAGNKATLTLSDGSVISLDEAGTGKLVEQGGTKVVKTADGLLTYTADQASSIGRAIQFNTISTPRGGQYKVVLPDGTKVWLNAGSALVYPTAFSGTVRKVKLSGEGYFEVARNKLMPFKVQTASQEIIVLGTHFNINAYADEPEVKTTLVEGSVRVTTPELRRGGTGRSRTLKPGEQSLLTKGNQLTVRKVDVATEIAWKSGVFSFQNTDIQVVAREFSRWYNVTISFEGELPDVKLWGEMDRNVSATEALEILHYFKLKYRITQEGKEKKIIISK